MTLLQILQQFCKRTGLLVPTIAFSSGDDQIEQLIGLANEVMEDLILRPVWDSCRREATWAATGVEDQGTLAGLAPYGYMYVSAGTFYDRSTGLEVPGPLSASEWQRIKALTNSATTQFRIKEQKMFLTPAPAVGTPMVFEYASSYGVASDAGVPQQYFEADTDVLLLPDILLLRGLRWMWKKEKGLIYTEEFRNYELACNQLKGNEGSKRVVSLDACGTSAGSFPGVIVPPGSWSIP